VPKIIIFPEYTRAGKISMVYRMITSFLVSEKLFVSNLQ